MLPEFDGQSVTHFIDAQKLVLDSAARQNAVVKQGLAPAFVGTSAEPLVAILHESIDGFIRGQKEFLCALETEESGAVRYSNGRQLADAGRLDKLTREGLRDVLNEHKRQVEGVKRQMGRPSLDPQRPGSADFAGMAAERIEAAIQSQKQLLELVDNLVDRNMQFLRMLV